MVFEGKVNKGVILAAGDGDRLGSLTLTYPKALLSVNDKFLISYPIEALVEAGISEIAIVVGYLRERVIQALGDGSRFGVRLEYIINPDYRGGNAISLYKARDWTRGEPVVLCMGDHLIEGELIRRLLGRKPFNETLCVDYAPAQHLEVAEATKVAVGSDGCIKNIGKNLSYWDALDTGVFLLTKNFFRVLEDFVRHYGINSEIEISDIVHFLINQEGYYFDTCSVSSCLWADIDTEEDLNRVRQMKPGRQQVGYILT